MNNPLWEWLVRTGIDPYCAVQRFHGPSSCEAGPAWCHERMGQPFVKLPDGRVLFIAGEHEDHYDPDFYIYNDVIVRHPDGRMDILGYPEDVFPPTDFHTATLLENRIVLIGNLGYPKDRKPGVTQVAVLELQTFGIRTVESTGDHPGWIHKHSATPAHDGKSILVRGGIIDPVTDDDRSLRENIDDWRLWLDDWRWERLTQRNWLQREFLRCDRTRLQLWDLAAHLRDIIPDDLPQPPPELMTDELRKALDEIRDLGVDMAFTSRKAIARLQREGLNTDQSLVDSLYRPPVPHEPGPRRDDEFNVTRIVIDGVVVRYQDEGHAVHLTIEGELPPDVVRLLSADLLQKLEKIQGAPCEQRPL
jgi:hypothetical protein